MHMYRFGWDTCSLRGRVALLGASLLVGMTLGGCAPAASVVMRQMGQTPLPSTCDVQFMSNTQQQIMAHGLPMATIIVEHAHFFWDEPMKLAVRPKVCEVGGHVAVFTMGTENSFNHAKSVTIMVWPGADAPAQ